MERYIENHILNQTKKLSDASYERIFSRNPRNEAGMYTYNCILCSVANLPGECALYIHIVGKKHQMRLSHEYVPDAKAFRAPLAIFSKIPTPYIIREPRPPGMEEKIPFGCYFDHYFSKTTKPLIGCEYLLEVMDPKMKEPLYICTLCDKRCDPSNIIPQVTSHRHRMKYLDFHFPALMTILNKSYRFNVDMTYREDVLSSITRKIEDRFGRLKPSIYEYREYEKSKAQITERLKNIKHFSEKDFPNWQQVLLNEIKDDLVDISSDENEHMAYREKAPRSFADNQPFQGEFSMKANGNPSTSGASTFGRRVIELSAETEKKFKESYIFEKYRISSEIAVNRLQLKYKDFDKSPEKHPDYSDEWKAFWQRRYNELLSEGEDANGHNYKPEWIDFWMPRMKQLKLKEVDKKKEEIRKNLNLSKEMAESFDEEIERKKRPRRSRSPIEISDDESDEERSRSSSNDRNKRFRRARCTPRSRYSERSRSRENSRQSSCVEVSNVGPINVVNICRILLALESELGFIAPRVVALLEQALAHERVRANSSDELLRDLKNINFLDMVKEKLKGLLVSELLGHSRIAPVKKAIREIAALLHEASKLKPSAPSTSAAASVSSIVQPDPAELANLEIAKVLAQTLLDQGKTNVSAEELAEIVDEFMRSQLNAMDESKEMMQVNDEPQPSSSSNNFSATEPPRVSQPSEEPRNENTGLEILTDEDLKTTLRNFSDLTKDEQEHLIRYLEKLDKSNPRRVQMLLKYVDAGDEEINEGESSQRLLVARAVSDDECVDAGDADERFAAARKQLSSWARNTQNSENPSEAFKKLQNRLKRISSYRKKDRLLKLSGIPRRKISLYLTAMGAVRTSYGDDIMGRVVLNTVIARNEISITFAQEIFHGQYIRDGDIVMIQVQSSDGSYQRTINCVVMPYIEPSSPTQSFAFRNLSSIVEPEDLADPEFNTVRDIDIAFNCEESIRCLQNTQMEILLNGMFLLNTPFKKIVGGTFDEVEYPESE